MNLIRCDQAHAGPILDIFNDAILNSTALYEYKPRTSETMTAWFETKKRSNFPVVGLVDEAGEFAGFGSYGTFRAFPAYKYTVEHSVYVAAKFRGRGAGKILLREVVRLAEEQNYHSLIGVIDSQRAKQLTEQLLRSIRNNRAKVVVVDITGVPTIDSTVANHLVQTVEASRLMGASVIITGLSSEIAQTLVTIGVDLSKMNAVGDLQGGIEEAERLLGYKVMLTAETAVQEQIS